MGLDADDKSAGIFSADATQARLNNNDDNSMNRGALDIQQRIFYADEDLLQMIHLQATFIEEALA